MGEIARKVNSDGSTTVILKGEFNIENAADLKTTLSEVLEESFQVNLNLKSLEKIDLTSLQTICSACKTAASIGRCYELEENEIPGCISELGRKIGAPQGIPCSDNSGRPCIWYGGVK